MSELTFRPVSLEDSEFIYDLRNEYVVRMNSFNTDKILYKSHYKWLNEKILDDETIFLIVYMDAIPIGQIRIDFENKNGIINYSIVKGYRGKGLGTKILKAIPQYVHRSKNKCEKLIGSVKLDNIASQKAFLNAGYECVRKISSFEYELTLNSII